jgi:hypothetical protein
MTSELKERTTPATPVGAGSVGTLPVETAEAPAAEGLRPDHVRSHSMRCYWDFVECRWRCNRD